MNHFKKPYGLDHPTWDQPTCFYHDTYDEAKASAVRTYGDSAHIVIGPVDEWKARAEAAERKVRAVRALVAGPGLDGPLPYVADLLGDGDVELVLRLDDVRAALADEEGDR